MREPISAGVAKLKALHKWLERLATSWPSQPGYIAVARDVARSYVRVLPGIVEVVEKLDQRYKGWSNYETWGMYRAIARNRQWWVAYASTAKSDAVEHPNCKGRKPKWTVAECSKNLLIVKLKNGLGGELRDPPGQIGELLDAVFERINWQELAESLLESSTD